MSCEEIHLVHISDTHGFHGNIKFPELKNPSILVVTGDFTDCGSRQEIEAFNEWLGYVKHRFHSSIIITGNHEYEGFLYDAATRGDDDEAMLKKMLSNATHVLINEAVTVCGITFYGVGWWFSHKASRPGDTVGTHKEYHRYNEIPMDADVLLTHAAPRGVLDRMEDTKQHWGSSATLRDAIERVGPKAHLFGHIHEQRGVWEKQTDGSYVGGVEYKPNGSVESWHTFPPPPEEYPCQVISNNAMKNHPDLEGRAPTLVGLPRIIEASREEGKDWKFSVRGRSR